MFVGLIFQISSLINFFLTTYLLALLVFFGYFEIAADGFLIISLISIFTYGLSANIRNIYLGTKSFVNINAIINFRIIVAMVVIALAAFIILLTVKSINFFFYFSLVLLIITNWVAELVIAKHEKNNLKFNNFLILQVLLIIFSTVTIFFNNLTLLSFFFIIYCIIMLYNFYKTYFKNFSFHLQNLNIISLGVLSTFLKYIANFAWRFFAIMLIGKTQSSVLFLAFSLGSLFVTIFDISYGAKWLKKIKYNNLFINIFFILYVLVCGIILNIFGLFSELDDKQNALFQSTTIFSVLGAYFLIFALQKRQTMYENVLVRKVCYNLDIITYAFNFCIFPILYYWNASYLNLSYLVSSLFCYILINFFYNVYSKKKFL
jgi:hypothetical protein